MIYSLTGRIDSATAPIVDKQIEKAINDSNTPVDYLILDCSDLEYISSSGLRIVLKYKKKYPNFEVVNTNRDVYAIFEMTGFSRMINVKRALRKIDLTKCTLLAQGENGAVYRVNEEEIVKVQHLTETEWMITDEIRRAKAAFVLGIPTAISFDLVDCGDGRHGAVYEALNTDTLGNYLNSHPEETQKLALKYAELLKTIHSTEAEKTEFGYMKGTYRRNFDVIEKEGILTKEEVDVCRTLLDIIPERNTLVHGDAHTNNILLGGDNEPMFIDMADTSIGHPIFDYTGIALAMICIQSNPEKCKSVCGMLPEQVNQFLAIAFATRLGLQSQEEIKDMMGRTFHLSLLKFVMNLGANNKNSVQLRPLLVGFLRQQFFPNFVRIREDIMWFVQRL